MYYVVYRDSVVLLLCCAVLSSAVFLFVWEISTVHDANYYCEVVLGRKQKTYRDLCIRS